MASFQKALARLMDERKADPAANPPARIATPLQEHLGQHLAADEVAAASSFTDLLLGNANGALDPIAAEDQVAALAASAFRFLADRRNQPFCVRVYRPTLETHGWATAHTVVEVVLDDQPHIVDTLCETLQAKGGEIEILLNPVLGAERDAAGALLAVVSPREAGRAEHLFHAQVKNLEGHAELEGLLGHHLSQLLRVSRDSAALRQRLSSVASELADQSADRAAAAQFLRWLGQGHFTLLGYDEDPKGTADNALGILAGNSEFAYEPLASEAPTALAILRSVARSPVQRLSHLVEVRAQRVITTEEAPPECRFVGLFTTSASRQASSEIPWLRDRFEELLVATQATDAFEPDVVRRMFDRFPIEIVAGSSTAQLLDLVRAQYNAETQGDLHLHRHPDRFGRNVFYTLFLPRRQFSRDVVGRVGAVLQRHAGPVIEHHVVQDERPLARFHFILAPAASRPASTSADLESAIRQTLQASEETRGGGGAEIAAMASTGITASEPGGAQRPRGTTPPAAPLGEGAIDIRARARGGLVLHIHSARESLVLGEFLPMVRNHGLLVLRQESSETSALGAQHSFAIEATRGSIDAPQDVAPLLIESLRAVRAGQCEDDALNALVLAARLPWRSVALLRTYVNYGAQLGAAPRDLAVQALIEYPEYAAALLGLFDTRFDPRLPIANLAQRKSQFGAADERCERLRLRIDDAAKRQVLGTLSSLLKATVRTNFHLGETPDGAAPAVAIKLAPSAVATRTASTLHSETYIHSTAFDAVVLRAGAVAHVDIARAARLDSLRGDATRWLRERSLRCSNTVALAGCGNVFVKSVSPARPSRDDIEHAFRQLAAVLLSITDNVTGDKVVPPRDLIAYDDIDPYLVLTPVPRDASLADALNHVALERGYWLEDAFSAGGSRGLGARRLAVGAAGAWECMRQHFREIGRDIGREEIDAIGTGSPGELRLSPTVRLRAAFDNDHIFLDPDPDPRESFEERQRLTHEALPSWGDYSPRRLSRGGAILSRACSQVQLPPESRAMLGLGDESARFDGDEIARAILRNRADLLWCAAPGTMVRGAEEPGVVGSLPEGEGARVHADEIRADIVIECTNAAFTASARVAFAGNGGRMYGAVIDNAAAVALDDREVIFKIALRGERAGSPTAAEDRDRAMTQAAREISDGLSEACAQQAVALCVERARSATHLSEYCDVVDSFAAERLVDRAADGIGSREEARARPDSRHGLTYPELAILAAVTKLQLRASILDTSLCEDHQLQPWIAGHLPSLAPDASYEGLREHPLRHEIAALEVSRRLVDTMGATFVERGCRFTGKSRADVCKAWTASYLVGRGEDVLKEVHQERDAVRVGDEIAAHLAIAHALERATFELLESQAGEASLAKLVDRMVTPIAETLKSWPDRLTPGRRRAYATKVDAFSAAGYSTDTADSIVRIASLQEVFLICDVAIRANAPRGRVCEAYLAIDGLFDLAWLEDALEGAADEETLWDGSARYALRLDLAAARRDLTRALLDLRSTASTANELVEEYATRRPAAIERMRQRITSLATYPRPPLAGLVVVVRELARLAAR